jgi:hypothetical protein
MKYNGFFTIVCGQLSNLPIETRRRPPNPTHHEKKRSGQDSEAICFGTFVKPADAVAGCWKDLLCHSADEDVLRAHGMNAYVAIHELRDVHVYGYA